MAAWTNDGIRLDIALAVVMEVSVLELTRADTDADRRRAQGFNSRLWRVVAALAPSAPLSEDRVSLRNAAAMVVGGGCSMDKLQQMNRDFARLLAGRAATDGALGHILDCWRSARRAGTELEFGPWLLDLLDGFTAAGHHSLAA